jgi:sensor domain CHASE-containing protein
LIKIVSASMVFLLVIGFMFFIISGVMFGTNLNQQLREACLKKEVSQRLSKNCTDVF